MQLKPLTLGSVSGCCSAYRSQRSNAPLENVNLHNWVKVALRDGGSASVCACVFVCVRLRVPQAT